MRVVRFLNQVAGGTTALYRIVFTGLLMFELVRFRLKNRRRIDEEVLADRSNRGHGRNRA